MNSDEFDASPRDVDVAGRFVRELIVRARKGALASLMPRTGAPYASLVNVASDNDGEPVLLLSRLAWHTQNILADNRVCLLITAEGEKEDMLALPRVSLLGQLRAIEASPVQEHYFNMHPKSRSYAQFADFSFFKLNVDTAHYVAGFGQIVTIGRTQLFRASR
jgi:heme oxygenase (biliverdin-IX-beta and delta-forming)